MLLITLGAFLGDMFLLFDQIIKAVSTEASTTILLTEEMSCAEQNLARQRATHYLRRSLGQGALYQKSGGVSSFFKQTD